MLPSVLLFSMVWTGTIALPVDVLKELLNKLESEEMSSRNIYQADSDSDSIAVALQKDKSWPDGFTMSLFYKMTGSAESTYVPVFEDKKWSELMTYKVNWGKLNGYKYSVSIDGLKAGTSYDVKTVVKKGDQVIGGQKRSVSTKAQKSLEEKLEDILKTFEDKDMSNRNIYQADSDSDSIAVALQKDKSWPGGFTVSLYYRESGADPSTTVAVFENKKWSELATYKVRWGKLNGYKYSVSIDGLKAGTSYDVRTVVKNGAQEIGGQKRTISTKAAKSMDLKEILKALKDIL